jgi:hypothetical protein
MFYYRLAFQYSVLEARMSEHGGVKHGSPVASQRNNIKDFGERLAGSHQLDRGLRMKGILNCRIDS